MVQASRRAGVTGSALHRLLARLNDTHVPEPQQAFAQRLSQWLGWVDAISLSAALDGGAAVTAAAEASGSAEERECARVRAALAKAIGQDSATADATASFAQHRRRYVNRQQAMETAIGPLRARLRATLASRSPAMARLAAMDAVMEQALGAQEHRLLATVPALLEKHFERLRRDDQPAHAFGKDMQSVLLAELDIRLQPVEGLLAALRKR